MPSNYDALRQAHRDALEQHIAQQNPQAGNKVSSADREPTRPEGHPSQSKTPGWTADQRMDQQNAAATQWAKAANERQEANLALRQHKGGQRGEAADKSPDAGRSADGRAEARQALDKHESGERNHKPTEREEIDARRALTAEHEAARKGNGIEI